MVDDSDIVRKRLVAMVSNIKEVVHINEARNAREAIESFDLMEPDLAIVDIQMPGVSGIEVLRHIKHKNKETTVIMYTSYPYPEYRKRCIDESADYFFDKTTESEELIDTIIRVISSKDSNN
ncbi:MAG: response regulator transcription factor [Nitrospirae bacterium]|nr:response regulator transcription factor [Nitrospirota bacterium]